LLTLGVLAVLTALASSGATASAQSADKKADLETRPEFREPIVLTSTDGVLEVRLTARQGQATLDTVATPVQNFLLFDYEVIRGTASNGQKSGGNLYPAPTLQVFPDVQLTETATGRTANRDRGAGRQSVYCRSLSADGQWDATAHSTGEPLRDCGDDTGRR